MSSASVIIQDSECRYSYRYNRKAQLVKNRKHECQPACRWTPQQDRDWLDETPVTRGPMNGGYTASYRSFSKLVPVQVCECGTLLNGQHYGTKEDYNGETIRGLSFRPCDYRKNADWSHASSGVGRAA